jgi:3-carboxy-cis,cis-muconate cycloisomerase
MGALLRDRPAASAEMLTAFGDAALLAACLRFEAALAGAQAEEGLIPRDAASRIRALCGDLPLDVPALAAEAAHAGTLAIPLVARLRDRAGEAARHVHAGATSQDLADTALMLQVQAGAALMGRDLAALGDAAAALARDHAATPALARTLLQAALPMSFGLKAAHWALGIDAARRRLAREADAAAPHQLGGAAGTRAGMAGRGAAVAARMAAELGLSCPPAPWHARRDGVAGVAAALAIAVGAIGKIARDVALLAQSEVAEAFEPRVPGRGGSSSMAHKRNPTGCQVALAAALRAPGLAATIFAALPQEHERGLGGWQAEGPVLAELFCLAHGALEAMLAVVAGLEVDAARMCANLAAARVGEDPGESLALTAACLAPRASGA